MPGRQGPTGIHPGRQSEGNKPVLLGYGEGREGYQQESLRSEPLPNTFSIVAPMNRVGYKLRLIMQN